MKNTCVFNVFAADLTNTYNFIRFREYNNGVYIHLTDNPENITCLYNEDVLEKC